jgi:hypothetical protein
MSSPLDPVKSGMSPAVIARDSRGIVVANGNHRVYRVVGDGLNSGGHPVDAAAFRNNDAFSRFTGFGLSPSRYPSPVVTPGRRPH